MSSTGNNCGLPSPGESQQAVSNTTEPQPAPKVRKPLKLSNKAELYIPDTIPKEQTVQHKSEEVTPNATQPAQQTQAKTNLLDELKPQRNNVQKGSAEFIPQPNAFPMYIPPMGQMMYGMQMFQPPQQQTAMPAASNRYESNETPSMEKMMQELMQEQYINVSPVVYNQVALGEEAPTSMRMAPDLQNFVNNLRDFSEEEQMLVFQEAIATGLFNNDNMNDTSGHHTYSDIDPNDFADPYDDDEPEEDPEDPSTWKVSEAEQKRRDEVRKQILSPDFKDCECCKGYVFNCSSEICKNLGICHCVAHHQNEHGAATEEIVKESANCLCCKGHVLSCSCVVNKSKQSCYCIQ